MNELAYHAAWISAALAGIAVLSALIARQLRVRETRRLEGTRLADALQRYAEWVALQRRAPAFHGETPEAAEALDEACELRVRLFPELADEMARLLVLHNRMLQFLGAQHEMRLRDPEAWLESDHDARFMQLWAQQCGLVQAMQDKLEAGGTLAAAPVARQSTYA